MKRSSASWVAAGGVLALVAVAGALVAVCGVRQAPPEEVHPAAAAESAAPVESAAPAAPWASATTATLVEAGAALAVSGEPEPSSEDAWMQRLRAIEDGDPAAALVLARHVDAQFPNGEGAAERAMIEVKSLARQGNIREARGAAEQMVNRYPGTPWALEVERHTGAHPRVNH